MAEKRGALPTLGRRTLPLRTKLVLWSAGSSLACAVALVILQFIALSDVVNAAFDDTGASGEEMHGTVVTDGGIAVQLAWSPAQIRSDVLAGLQLWSVVFVVGFALVSTAVAWHLARKLASGVAALTAVAADVSAGRRGKWAEPADADADIRVFGETFNRMLDRLDSDLARRELYAANASHELRTPIARARLALEIPLSQDRVPRDLIPEMTDCLGALTESERIISSLLTLAKADEVSIGADATPVDLAGVARDEIAGVRRLAHESDIGLQSSLDSVIVRGHPELLAVVVRNLLENAVRHNRAGGAVWVETTARGDDAVVRVRNDGTRFEHDEVEWLRDPFHRGRDARRSDTADRGAGLGLSIAANLVTAHEGTLHIAARDEGGLDIHVTLPRHR